MLEAAGAHERFLDRREIGPVLFQGGANGVEITERRMERERAGEHALALEQLQQPPGAGLEEARAPVASDRAPRRSGSSAHAAR